jgi:hypothetical protein
LALKIKASTFFETSGIINQNKAVMLRIMTITKCLLREWDEGDLEGRVDILNLQSNNESH